MDGILPAQNPRPRVSAGRRVVTPSTAPATGQPSFVSSRPSNDRISSVTDNSTVNQSFRSVPSSQSSPKDPSDNESSNDDEEEEEEEGVDAETRMELRKKFFEGLVTQWKSRKTGPSGRLGVSVGVENGGGKRNIVRHKNRSTMTYPCGYTNISRYSTAPFDSVSGDQGPPSILFRCHLRNTILDVLMARKWTESDSETVWDLGWVGRDWIRNVYTKVYIDAHQRVNHYRNFFELTKKDSLMKNLKKMRRGVRTRDGGNVDTSNTTTTAPTTSTEVGQQVMETGSLYAQIHRNILHTNPDSLLVDFMPETFVLPSEYLLFLEAFKKSQAPAWIMKPVSRCQGQGIFLFNKLKSVQDWAKASLGTKVTNNPPSSTANAVSESAQAETYVVQEYIADPLLVGGKKFDMRIYVMVPSYMPLTVWLCREGFCRFSSVKYDDSASNITNSYMHLTNVAVQKKGVSYDDDSGGKWDLRSLKLYIVAKHGMARANALFLSIQDCIVKCLLSVTKTMINDSQSFALYGFDIMIDANLKVWIIEINACPSLSANTAHDYNLKFDMLSDAMTILNLDKARCDNGSVKQIGSWDLIFQDGAVGVGGGGIGGHLSPVDHTDTAAYTHNTHNNPWYASTVPESFTHCPSTDTDAVYNPVNHHVNLQQGANVVDDNNTNNNNTSNNPLNAAFTRSSTSPAVNAYSTLASRCYHSLLGAANNRLDQLPTMYALSDMTERSDINANIAQMNKAATAAAVGLKPSTNKKPVFK